MAVTWDGSAQGLGSVDSPDAILGHPTVDGEVLRVLCGHGETHRGGSSPLGALPTGRPQAPRFHTLFLGGICRNPQTLHSHGSTEQPHTEHLPFPGSTSCPRAWHSPFSAPTTTPWVSPAPTWIPITLSDPMLGTLALGVPQLSPFMLGRVVLPPHNPSSLPPPFSPLSPLSQALREGERF